MQYAIGVDIGGTKISVTLGNSRGEILSKKVIPTQTGRHAKAGIQALLCVLQDFKSHQARGLSLKGIGIGIPGPMDPAKGIVERSPNLKGWEGFHLKNFLEKKLRLPVVCVNDADAAAVGEMAFGKGAGVGNFVYVTVSTGIGSGIILDGKLLIGASFGAGEFGHTIIVAGGDRCGCGQKGCVEAYASGTAIARWLKSKANGTRYSGTWYRSAEGAAEAARKKNALALQAFERAGFYLGVGLANLINLLNPEKLILGGSVLKSADLFWGDMMKSVHRHSWPSLYRACRIVKTSLGDRVGDLGALALVFAQKDLLICRSFR